MTFTDIVTDVCDRLSLTSADDLARVGRAVNRIYKKITADLGIKHVAKRATVSATCSLGVSTLTFTASEKPVNVYNRNSTPYTPLIEYSLDELEADMPFGASDAPTRYAVKALTADTVVILLNCLPQTAFDLHADVYATTATLSGTDEPAFPESAHDILLHGVLVDEYMKIEKPALSKLEEGRYRERLGELRLWIRVSTTMEIHQGKTAAGGHVGGAAGGGGGSGVNGATSYTQTGLVTFDRGAGAPFAVVGGAAVVANLDADKLDGQHGSYYQSSTNQTAGTLPDARFPAVLPAISGALLTNVPAPAAINAATITSGTLPDARFPAVLPAISAANLTNVPAPAAINAATITSGTLPDARFPATLPAASGVNLTALNASNAASGNLPIARMPTGGGTWAMGGALALTGGHVTNTAQLRCSAYATGTQSLTTGTETSLALAAEDFDVGTLHDTVTNNTRLTIPSGGDGLYLISGQVSIAANATGFRIALIRKNGTTELSRTTLNNAGASGTMLMPLPITLAALVAGDYIEAQARQDSGGNLDSGSATRYLSNIVQIVKLW